MDEARTSPARAKERESHPAGAESDSEGVERPAHTQEAHEFSEARAANGAEAPANGPIVEVAADSDESAVTSGTPEAAALGAAARGIDEEAAAPDAASRAAVSGSVESQGERELELDFDEADRFAASIRPSWADPEPPPPPAPPSQAIGAKDGVARVIRHNTRIDLNPPLRKRRGSALAILGASLLGVAGLLYLGISSSSVDHDTVRGLNEDAQAKRVDKAPVEPETSVGAAQTPPAVQPELERRGPRLSDPEPGEPAEAIANAEPGAIGDTQATVEGEVPADPSAANPQEGAQLAAAADQAPQAEPVAVPAEAPTAPQPEPLAAAPQPQIAAAPQAEPQPQIGAAPQPAPQPQIAAAPQPAAAPTNPAQPARGAAQAPRAAQPNPKLAANQVPDLKALQPSAALAPRPEAAGGGDKVLLSLAAYPPSTRLRIDGLLVENPYKARVPKSSKHRIDAAAPGFAPETHVMRMEADVQLMISLKREPPRDVKADPYRDAARRTPTAVGAKRDRGAGFVAENPY